MSWDEQELDKELWQQFRRHEEELAQKIKKWEDEDRED